MTKRLFLLFGLFTLLTIAVAAFGADSPSASLFLSGTLSLLAVIGVGRRLPSGLEMSLWLGLWGGGVILLGQLAGPAPAHSLPDLATILGAGAVYLTVLQLARSRSGLDYARYAFSVTLILIGVLAFVDFVSSPTTLYGAEKGYHEHRLTAAFLSANSAATFFGMASLFGLGGVLRFSARAEDTATLLDRFAKGGILPLLVLIFSLTCLVLTASRGGMAATILAAGVLVWWDRREGRDGLGWKGGTAIVAGLVVIVALTSGGIMQDRLTELGTDDTGRRVMWAVCFDAWKAAPLFGHGFGRFEMAIAPYITAETAGVLSVQGAAHNILLQWLVQAGLVGLVGGVSLVLAAGWPIVRGLRRRPRTLLRTVAAIALMVFVHGQLDYGLEIPAIVWWFSAYLGLGAGAALAETSSRRRRRAGRPAADTETVI